MAFQQPALAIEPATENAPLRVVVTIRPIHSLVSAVLQGVTTPKLLLEGASSPHDYALKPSDAEALSHAQVIIRVSENLETFLNKPLQVLGAKAKIISLDQTPDLTLLPTRTWAHDEDSSHDHEDEDHHHHGSTDVHFWLDPMNAIIIVDALTQQFSELDPPHAALIQANAETLKAKLKTLNEDLRAQFAPVQNRPFVVFHDVLQYLEKRYDLRSTGVVTLSPERQPGARHLSDLRKKIKDQGVVCVFAEPQFPPKLITTLTEGLAVRSGTIDEIGIPLPPGPDQYISYIHWNADHIVSCLQQ